jgi:hypothetical protein
MRRTTAFGTVGGRPSLTPAAFFIASASRVRCEISRRSSWTYRETRRLILRGRHSMCLRKLRAAVGRSSSGGGLQLVARPAGPLAARR